MASGASPSRWPWLARLGPRGIVGGRAELGLTLACVLALVTILAAELLWTRQATIGALGVFPVSVAGWLLGRRGLSAVVLGGMALRGVAFALGMVGWLTAISQAAVLPLAGIACYLAASSRSATSAALDRDRRVRDLAFLLRAAETLASSLDTQVILSLAVQLTAEGVSRPGGGKPARAAYHRLQGQVLRVEAVEDDPEDGELGFEYPLARDQGALGAIRSGRASIVRPDHMTGALAEHVISRQLRVLALAPVRSGDEVHGFLVASARDGLGLDRRELSLLEVLARMTGLALSNGQHMQIQRQHAERMEGLEKVKSHILNLVSHELRSPLTVAVGYVSMLEEEALGPLTPESRAVLPIVMAKLNAMETLVGQMLEVSRLEESALVLKRECLDLREVCRETVDTMRPLIGGEHRVMLEEPAGEVSVFADRDRLGTILVNLLSNAIKYSPGGGEVRCVVGQDASHPNVAISDHGLGIADEDLPRLFTRFGRILTPENRGISGTGLGLYLSRELARQHGGDIAVLSKLDSGSTFTLSLPAAPSRGQAK
ncbi:MAG: HAMP domain-containing histidine kinase [Candidatus Dormibacteraeota bacterium]|nr:HAMP domain-containing histidine kinase [Candidatus Dormibacteraeota bacterium]